MATIFSRCLQSFFDTFSKARKPRKHYKNRRDVRSAQIELLESRKLLTVTFQGGPVLANVETQAVFLGADWQTNATLRAQTTQINQFLTTIVSGAYMDMLTNAGYGVGRGTSSAGVVDNIALNKVTGVTDAAIQNDIQSLIKANHVQAPDANRLYVVYVEPGVAVFDGSSSSINDFLGYHGAFGGKTAANKPIDIRYAVLPYPGGPNPTAVSQGFASNFQELTVVTSHEIAEAATDPNVGYKTTTWYDDQLNGEIGDLTDLTANLNGYLVQQVVDKNDNPIAPNKMQAPRNVTAKATSGTTAKLTWTTVLGATGYRVYQVIGTRNVLLMTLTGAATTSVVISKLVAGSTNSFKIEAYNSSSKATTSIITVSLPNPPASASTSASPPAATDAPPAISVFDWRKRLCSSGVSDS